MAKEFTFSKGERIALICIIVFGAGLLILGAWDDMILLLLVIGILAALCVLMEFLRRMFPSSRIAGFLTGVIGGIRDFFGGLLFFV